MGDKIINFRLLISTAVFSLLLGASSYASIQTVPDDLLAGAQYRLVFVTSVTRNATSSNIEDYNDFVNDAANAVGSSLAGLGATWNVIGSTSSVDARDNTGTNPATVGVPIYLVDGTLLADDNADFWDGTSQALVNVNETGVILDRGFVWTGSETNGQGDSSRSLGAVTVNIGQVFTTGGSWVSRRGFPAVGNSLGFYGLSDPLTVPTSGGEVPEPTSVLVWGLLGIGVVASRRHRKQAIHS